MAVAPTEGIWLLLGYSTASSRESFFWHRGLQVARWTCTDRRFRSSESPAQAIQTLEVLHSTMELSGWCRWTLRKVIIYFFWKKRKRIRHIYSPGSYLTATPLPFPVLLKMFSPSLPIPRPNPESPPSPLQELWNSQNNTTSLSSTMQRHPEILSWSTQLSGHIKCTGEGHAVLQDGSQFFLPHAIGASLLCLISAWIFMAAIIVVGTRSSFPSHPICPFRN